MKINWWDSAGDKFNPPSPVQRQLSLLWQSPELEALWDMGKYVETSRAPGQLLILNPLFLLNTELCSLSSPAQAPVNSVPYPLCSARAKRDTHEMHHACFCLFAAISKWEHKQSHRAQLHQEGKKKSKSDEQFTERFRVEECLEILEPNLFSDI